MDSIHTIYWVVEYTLLINKAHRIPGNVIGFN